jgi:hypothetical protein
MLSELSPIEELPKSLRDSVFAIGIYAQNSAIDILD